MKTSLSILCILCVSALSQAHAVTLEWDPSPDAWVAGYRLYASTNSVAVHQLTNALRKVDVGTNTVCSLTNLAAGRWFFVATAYATEANGTNIVTLESLPSNEVIAAIPEPPANMRTVHVQWSGQVLSTNWQDVGFFRIKLGP